MGWSVTFESARRRDIGSFTIKYVEGQDDFAMMAEVTERYSAGCSTTLKIRPI